MILGIAKTSVNIRSGASGDFPIIDYLREGDVVEADYHQLQWLHLTKVNNIDIVRESWASAGVSQQYIAWDEKTIPDETIIPSEDDVFGFVLHDYDLYRKSRPTYLGSPRGIKGLPETVSILDKNGFISLTESIQYQWYDWCSSLCDQSEAENKASFASLTKGDRAFTNRYGSDGYACYPCGNTNKGKEPMRLFPLLAGGAYIKIIGGFGTGILTFETLSSTEDLTQYHPFTHPHLFFSPTNSIRIEIWKDKKTGRIVPANNPKSIWSGKWIEYKVDPFPQFQGKAIVPIMTNNAKSNRIEASKVRILTQGATIPSPFVQ